MAENQPWFVAAFYHLALDNACNALLTTFRIRTYTTNPRSLIYPSSRFIQLLLIKFYRWLKYELTNQGLPVCLRYQNRRKITMVTIIFQELIATIAYVQVIVGSRGNALQLQIDERYKVLCFFTTRISFVQSVSIMGWTNSFDKPLPYPSLIFPKKMATSVSRTSEYHGY